MTPVMIPYSKLKQIILIIFEKGKKCNKIFKVKFANLPLQFKLNYGKYLLSVSVLCSCNLDKTLFDINNMCDMEKNRNRIAISDSIITVELVCVEHSLFEY